MNRKYIFIIAAFCIGISLQAQQPNLYPRPSQMAKVFQRIGTTDLEIVYHAPLAKGRKVFGEVVTYNEKNHDKPQPWRAGANENTIIKIGHDVEVNGKPLKAGEYGLHIFVSERSWELVFSNDSKNWGSFSYDAAQDALRVGVTPHEASYQEWLSYRFINPKGHMATVELRWADKQITFDISTNVDANIIAEVEKMETKTAPALLAAANSTLELNPDAIDEAMALVDQSIALNASMNGRLFKVRLLEKQGKTKEAKALKAEAIDKGNAIELFSYAMSLNNKGEREECKRILDLNLEKHPEHQYSYMGFGHYYRTAKDPRTVEYWKKAYEKAPERSKGFYYYQWGFAKSQLEKQ